MTINNPGGFPPPNTLDPNLDAATLAQIAQTDPTQWQAILVHQNVYPELTAWITAQMPAAQAPAAQATPVYAGTQYAMAQPAAGAQSARPQGKPQPKYNWPSMVQTGLAAVLLISLFLPIASGYGESIGYFTDEADFAGLGSGTAITLIFFMLLIGGLTVPLLFMFNNGLRIAAGVVSIVFGLISLIMLFTVRAAVAIFSYADISVGFGLIISLICAFGLIVSGIILLAIRQK